MTARRLRGLVVLAAAAGIWSVAALLLWRSRVPGGLHLPHVAASRLLDPRTLHRAARFDRFERIDWALSEVALLGVLAVYAARGARFARESAAGRIGTGMLLAMLGFGIVWLAQLPFGLAGLWWERRHGLARTGYLAWAIGSWFSLGDEFLFICLAILIVMALAGRLRERWWLLGGPVFVALALLASFAQPYLTPGLTRLHDPPLRTQIRALARREGLPAIPVEVEDVHEETTAPNAEAVGIGPSRRVILADTLLDGRFSPAEIRVVAAHELGHLARGHIWKQVGWYALFALPGAFVIARATRRRGGMAEAAAVPLSLFVFVALQLVALPLQNVITRHLESEADWMALQTTRDPRAARSLFVRLAATSLAQPSPPLWDYVLLEDHPTIAQRVAMVEAWQRLRRP